MAAHMQWSIKASEVLYEDAFLIAVDKPHGLPSQATLDPSRDHAYAAVIRYLSGAYVGLHHRLDVATSGVLLMTKDKRANASISEQFKGQAIAKSYCALCAGPGPILPEYLKVGASFLIDRAIGELPKERRQRYGVDGRGRKSARTEVTCTSSAKLSDGYFGSYICAPLTGRTHQIRVHMSSIGLGILGDNLYGDWQLRSLRARLPNRMFLHASSICFSHPISGESICVKSPLPEAFEQVIKKLRGQSTING